MDDKYKKHYEKKQTQFPNHLGDKWDTKNKQWGHESSMMAKKPKPDPATVEAELQLEEQLWAS